MNKKIYKRILIYLLFFTILFSINYYLEFIKERIPDNIYVKPGEAESVELNIPFIGKVDLYKDNKKAVTASVNMLSPLTINANRNESYFAKVKLFGVFTIKEINVNVKEPQEVIVAGIPVGIHLETRGVLVVDIGNVVLADGETQSPSRGILRCGDYIMAVNGIDVGTKKEVMENIQKSGDIITLTIMRNKEIITQKIHAVKDENGQNKIGVWVRDDFQGLGTLTYITADLKYGALGHAISNSANGEVVNIKNGYIYTANIWSIVKGKIGNPGELVGSINYGNENYLGEITKNCNKGIYGNVDRNIFKYVENKYIKSVYKQNVKKGKAFVRTFVDSKIKDYEIEITGLSYSEKDKNKGIVFEVTSKELMDITNGIVQGMSGSPIIQDGKIIGAVTHVFINDPSKGYGIFVENMLEE